MSYNLLADRVAQMLGNGKEEESSNNWWDGDEVRRFFTAICIIWWNDDESSFDGLSFFDRILFVDNKEEEFDEDNRRQSFSWLIEFIWRRRFRSSYWW